MTERTQTVDVVVIGGGIIGLSSAYALAKEGVSVTVLERGQCGQESSWAGAGVLQCGHWHRTDPPLLVYQIGSALNLGTT